MARGPRKPKWFVNKGKRKRNLQAGNQKGSNKGNRKKLLNLSRERDFLYDLDEVLDASKAAENQGVLRANLLKKASQNGIDEAIEYLDEVKGTTITEPTADKIERLLKRYSTWRT